MLLTEEQLALAKERAAKGVEEIGAAWGKLGALLDFYRELGHQIESGKDRAGRPITFDDAWLAWCRQEEQAQRETVEQAMADAKTRM